MSATYIIQHATTQLYWNVQSLHGMGTWLPHYAFAPTFDSEADARRYVAFAGIAPSDVTIVKLDSEESR